MASNRIATPERVILLLSLVPYLLENGETRLATLAEAFGIDEPLMRELVEFLGTTGAPGETNTYQDEDLFDIDWVALEEEGLVRLVKAVVVEDAPRFSVLERAALIAGLHSLTPMLPQAELQHAESAAAKLRAAAGAGTAGQGSVDRPGDVQVLSSSENSEDPLLSLVARVIESGERLSFDYEDLRGEVSSRTVEPLALVQTSTGWYLRAYCLDRSAERTFVLDGMRSVRARPAGPARRPADPTSQQNSGSPKPHAGSIGPVNAKIVAQLRVRESALHRISAFSPKVQGPSGEGWVRATVKLAYPAAAIRLVQASPGDVTVDTPSSAREAVLEWADRALAQYDA